MYKYIPIKGEERNSMNVIEGDLFAPPYEVDAICISTNGILNKEGNGIMGAGIAKIIKDMYPIVQQKLGEAIKESGNVVHYLGKYEINERSRKIFSFPTKHHWKDKADINLIKKSAKYLSIAADIFRLRNIWLPAPGCGLGGLLWKDVEPVLEKYLDNRFTIDLQ